jgi:3-methyladenine DNA glycosylase Mpg
MKTTVFTAVAHITLWIMIPSVSFHEGLQMSGRQNAQRHDYQPKSSANLPSMLQNALNHTQRHDKVVRNNYSAFLMTQHTDILHIVSMHHIVVAWGSQVAFQAYLSGTEMLEMQ